MEEKSQDSFVTLDDGDQSEDVKDADPHNQPISSNHLIWRLNALRSHKHFILMICLIAVLVDGLFYTLMIPIIPIYIQEFDIGQVGVGILFASFALTLFIGSLAFGPLSDRFGRRLPMLMGLVVLLGSTLMFAFAQNFVFLLIARILQGAASAATWTAAMATVGDVYPANEQGKPYGIMLTLTGVGAMAGPLISGVLIELGGGNIRTPFLVAIGFLGIDTIARFIMREPKIRSELESKDETTGHGYNILLKDGVIMLASASAGAIQIVMGGLEAILPVHLANDFGLNSFWIGIFWGCLLLTFCLASTILGSIVDRVPNRRLDLIALGLFGVCIVQTIAVLVDNLYAQVILFCLSSPFYSVVFTTQLPAVNDVIDVRYGGKYRGAASAITNCCVSIGATIGPLLYSFLMDKLGFKMGATICNGLMGIFVILFAFSIFYLKRRIAPLDPSNANEMQIIKAQGDEM